MRPSHTRHPRRSAGAIVLTLLFAGVILAGCGDSDGDASADRAPAGEEGASNAANDADGAAEQEWGDDAPWRDGDVQLRAHATGLKVAMMAERVEVDGTTIHVYLKDGARVPGGACMVANAGLPDGASVTIHQDGDETPC